MRQVSLLAADLAAARPPAALLAERGLPTTVQVAGELRLDLAVRRSDIGVCVNLVGEDATAALRAFIAEYLAYLADIEVPVVNGLDAFVIGASPARQLALLDHLGVQHPPARVLADEAGMPAAVAELGGGEVRVSRGPPLVVQAAPDVGPVVRIDYVAGRQLAASAEDRPVTVDVEIGRLGAAIVQTGAIEFGGVSFGVDPATQTPTCVGLDTRLPTAPRALDALVEHVAGRAGLAAGR